jgi:hypothetical protein
MPAYLDVGLKRGNRIGDVVGQSIIARSSSNVHVEEAIAFAASEHPEELWVVTD